jgi:hypothetical protein
MINKIDLANEFKIDADFYTELTHSSNFIISAPNLLLQGDYFRSGDDLRIEHPDFGEQLIEGYFATPFPPALSSPTGATLLPETVNHLLQNSPHPILVAGPFSTPEIVSGRPVIGTVNEMNGLVSVKGDGGEIRILQSGDAIHLNDVVRTLGDLSSIGIRMVDDTSFQLGGGSRAVLDNYQYDAESESGSFGATVLSGSFRYASGKLGGLDKGGAHSTIKTPTAVMGIRGSELEGKVGGDGSTTFVHLDGILDVSDVDGLGMITLTEPGTATSVIFGEGAPKPIFKAPDELLSELRGNLPPRPAFADSTHEEDSAASKSQATITTTLGHNGPEITYDSLMSSSSLDESVTIDSLSEAELDAYLSFFDSFMGTDLDNYSDEVIAVSFNSVTALNSSLSETLSGTSAVDRFYPDSAVIATDGTITTTSIDHISGFDPVQGDKISVSVDGFTELQVATINTALSVSTLTDLKTSTPFNAAVAGDVSATLVTTNADNKKYIVVDGNSSDSFNGGDFIVEITNSPSLTTLTTDTFV